jgi:hypothetical protein
MPRLLGHDEILQSARPIRVWNGIFAAGDRGPESGPKTISPNRDRNSETTTREKWPQKRLSASKQSVAAASLPARQLPYDADGSDHANAALIEARLRSTLASGWMPRDLRDAALKRAAACIIVAIAPGPLWTLPPVQACSLLRHPYLLTRT